mmetsp:Transcript_40738/g.112053  ORF Transcript_40738/g.112053 Transcript_40738/m.112053 type:complete len:152 (-) Transcript_40738:88-543(-)
MAEALSLFELALGKEAGKLIRAYLEPKLKAQGVPVGVLIVPDHLRQFGGLYSDPELWAHAVLLSPVKGFGDSAAAAPVCTPLAVARSYSGTSSAETGSGGCAWSAELVRVGSGRWDSPRAAVARWYEVRSAWVRVRWMSSGSSAIGSVVPW